MLQMGFNAHHPRYRMVVEFGSNLPLEDLPKAINHRLSARFSTHNLVSVEPVEARITIEMDEIAELAGEALMGSTNPWDALRQIKLIAEEK